MKKLVLLLGIIILLANVSFSQEDKTVTLTVSGQGKTQDEAKQNALRSAIEQAFGTFISSKTEILNDNLVKDEIVSVSNGNIQKYEIISEVQIPSGEYATSLKATVSVTKLTTFVESKGVVVDFKGSIFAANVKQQILNEQNEVITMQNISKTCKDILDQSCNYKMIRGEPKQKNNDNNLWMVPITINVNFNKNIEQFSQYLYYSLRGLSMSNEEVEQYKQQGKKTYKIAIGRYENDGSFPNPIYYFRVLPTIISIIDLISYTKHSILNFEICNGIDTITPQKLITDLMTKKSDGFSLVSVKTKGYQAKIIRDNLTPIFNTGNFETSHNDNGPAGIFGSYNSNYFGYGEVLSEYKIINEYSAKYYYNGGRNGVGEENYYYNGGRNGETLYYNYTLDKYDYTHDKYGFLIKADSALPKGYVNYMSPELRDGDLYNSSNNGYVAVISLFDFYSSDKNVISLYYDDIHTLSEIEKIQEYKINPIIKN